MKMKDTWKKLGMDLAKTGRKYYAGPSTYAGCWRLNASPPSLSEGDLIVRARALRSADRKRKGASRG